MPRLPQLRDELLALTEGERPTEDELARFAEIVQEHGWPGLRAVGADGADAAWWLAVHADRQQVAEGGWLERLADAVASGDADPRHLAIVTDHLAAAAGEQQVYGTIAHLAADGEVEFSVPVGDPTKLEARRATIGLPSIAADAPALADGDLVPHRADR